MFAEVNEAGCPAGPNAYRAWAPAESSRSTRMISFFSAYWETLVGNRPEGDRFLMRASFQNIFHNLRRIFTERRRELVAVPGR
jgi:hypothetical protein